MSTSENGRKQQLKTSKCSYYYEFGQEIDCIFKVQTRESTLRPSAIQGTYLVHDRLCSGVERRREAVIADELRADERPPAEDTETGV